MSPFVAHHCHLAGENGRPNLPEHLPLFALRGTGEVPQQTRASHTVSAVIGAKIKPQRNHDGFDAAQGNGPEVL
jgi:hypothetical protein